MLALCNFTPCLCDIPYSRGHYRFLGDFLGPTFSTPVLLHRFPLIQHPWTPNSSLQSTKSFCSAWLHLCAPWFRKDNHRADSIFLLFMLGSQSSSAFCPFPEYCGFYISHPSFCVFTVGMCSIVLVSHSPLKEEFPLLNYNNHQFHKHGTGCVIGMYKINLLNCIY